MQLDPPEYAQQLTIGETIVFWLPASQQIIESLIDQYLHEHEHTELALITAPSRRFEFRRTRFLIRHLTHYKDALRRDPLGAPSWPPGLMGSITHKNGAVGVAIEPLSYGYGLGIDAEVLDINLALEPRILSHVESRLLDGQADRKKSLAIAFAFKEALFKACYPRGRTMFYFHDAEILTLDLKSKVIHGRLLKNVGPKTPAGSVWKGEFLIHEDSSLETTKERYAICAVRIPD